MDTEKFAKRIEEIGWSAALAEISDLELGLVVESMQGGVAVVVPEVVVDEDLALIIELCNKFNSL